MRPPDLTGLGCGAVTIGADGRVSANEIVAEWMGQRPSRLEDLLTPASLIYWDTAVTSLLATRGFAFDLGLDLATPEPIPVVINARQTTDGGAVEAILLRFDDRRRFERAMAESRLREQAQAQRLEALEAADAFRRDFINSAAHELATPMTPIRMQLHLLKRSVQGGDDSVEALERNLGHLERFVENLRWAARIQSGPLRVQSAPVDLADLVRSAVSDWNAKHDSRQVQLPSTPTAIVCADPAAFSIAFAHLVSNARKFDPQGEPEVRVLLQPPRVVIKDKGIGIEPEKITSLGRPFAQAHDRSAITTLGAGLGLHVASGLMEAMGGRLRLESEGIGCGTTATLELSVPAADAPENT